MRSSLVRRALMLPALTLLLAGCDVEGRIEGFVTDPPLADVESVEVTPDSLELVTGQDTSVSATALDGNGSPVQGVNFLWDVVSDEKTISLNPTNTTAQISATTPGRYEIRGSAGAVASDTAVVIVSSPGQ